jgi:hypothetical protein
MNFSWRASQPATQPLAEESALRWRSFPGAVPAGKVTWSPKAEASAVVVVAAAHGLFSGALRLRGARSPVTAGTAIAERETALRRPPGSGPLASVATTAFENGFRKSNGAERWETV